MEALCSPRTGELSSSQLLWCLGALHALLEGPWARAQLTAEPGILVELCNVLHRLLLSHDTAATQVRIMMIIIMVMIMMTMMGSW